MAKFLLIWKPVVVYKKLGNGGEGDFGIKLLRWAVIIWEPVKKWKAKARVICNCF